MSREISADIQTALDDDVIYPFFAVELKFDGDQVLRLWTGQGTLVYNGSEWFGAGQLLNIDTIEETTEIAAKGATITLSGVPTEVLALALTEPYQGRAATVYFGMLNKTPLQDEIVNGLTPALILHFSQDSYYSEETTTTEESVFIFGLSQVFSGYMDQMNIEEGADTTSVQLTVENKLIDLEKPRTARFTSAYQKSLFPNDKGFDFVEDLQTKEIVWGRTVE